MCRPDPQYLVVSVRKAKYTHLGYGIRLSRLHTPDPISVSLSMEQPFSNTGPKQENNQGTPDKPQVPQADPPVTGLHNSN
jgi:hypothetical protein